MPRKLDPKVAEKVMLKAGLKPLEPYSNSASPWKCKCQKCGETCYPRYGDISSNRQRGGCKPCGYRKVSAESRFSAKEAHRIMIESGYKPLERYRNSRTKWKSKCMKCGNIVFPKFNTIRNGIGGCRTCGNEKLGARRRFKSETAVAIMLKAKMKPLSKYTNARTRWKSKCLTCKKISEPTLNNVIGGHGCVYCTGHKVDEADAIKIMLKSSLKPLEPYTDNRTKWKSKCLKCGRIVYPIYNSITTKQGGCRYCAEKGINMNTPSYLYLITHYELNSHKVGMGNHKKVNDRLGRFTKEGWKTYKVWDTKTGAEAIDIETEVFKVLRKELKLPIHLTKAHMRKTEGHTETVNADSITLLELEKIIKKVIKGYRNNP